MVRAGCAMLWLAFIFSFIAAAGGALQLINCLPPFGTRAVVLYTTVLAAVSGLCGAALACSKMTQLQNDYNWGGTTVPAQREGFACAVAATVIAWVNIAAAVAAGSNAPNVEALQNTLSPATPGQDRPLYSASPEGMTVRKMEMP
jgi:hypothetical protein